MEEKLLAKLKDFLLDIFFPPFCLNCQKEGSLLCEDCQALIPIESWVYCPVCQKRTLNFRTHKNCQRKTELKGLLWAVSYENILVKKIIHQFKYEPFVKDLSRIISQLITAHFLLVEFFETEKSKLKPEDFILIPVPLHKKRLKWRGFNQAREIAFWLSQFLEIPLMDDLLIKIKKTQPQVELAVEERKENIEGAFWVKNPEKILQKKILLLDDVFTSGSTLEEGARLLKEAGAKEIWGLVAARG